MRAYWVLIAVLAVIAWQILAPSLRILWRERRTLWDALKFRVTEPELWRECKAEMKRDGEWL